MEQEQSDLKSVHHLVVMQLFLLSVQLQYSLSVLDTIFKQLK